MRDMVINRFTAAGIPMHQLAIEPAGEELRVTGSVATAEERDRAVGILNELKAQGVKMTCRIEVRPQQENVQTEDRADQVLRFPTEPA